MITTRKTCYARSSFDLRLGLGVLIVATLSCRSDSPTDPFIKGVVLAGLTTELKLSVEQRSRSYIVHEPKSPASTANPLPLIIILHGSSQQGADIRAISAMDSLAEARRFVVAYPNGVGTPSDWNAGNCCGSAHDEGVNDIAFLKAIIADLSKRLPIDSHRIYVSGFSDGGRMAYRAACEMASQVVAVAVVSGSLVMEKCAPSRSVFVVAFHGTADPTLRYGDLFVGTVFPRAAPKEADGLPLSIRFWMAANSCTRAGNFQITPHVVRTTATGCSAEVIFYSIAGGQHAWPVTGADYEISASPLIADFFAAHRRP